MGYATYQLVQDFFHQLYVDVFFFGEPSQIPPEKIRLQVLPLLRNPRRVWPSGVIARRFVLTRKKHDLNGNGDFQPFLSFNVKWGLLLTWNSKANKFFLEEENWWFPKRFFHGKDAESSSNWKPCHLFDSCMAISFHVLIHLNTDQ